MIITLLSDFGMRDPYVAEMKGVILSIDPHAVLVDITHEVKKFDVRSGAFILANSAQYFPAGTIHLAVIDPGVGGERRPIIVETEKSIYVGPDNGLLILSALKEGVKRVVHITNERYFRENISKTFHGRDVFAPIAAHLARGEETSMFGKEVSDYFIPSFAEPRVNGKRIIGEILHIDDFGNIVTNIPEEVLLRRERLESANISFCLGGKKRKVKLRETYCHAEAGTPLALIGSHGFLELSVSLGSAEKMFRTTTGEPIEIHLL